MPEQRPCDVCESQAAYSTTRSSPQNWGRVIRRCPRCGEFEYDHSIGLPKIQSRDEMVRLSGWIREQTRLASYPSA
jgi:hypothetical protein